MAAKWPSSVLSCPAENLKQVTARVHKKGEKPGLQKQEDKTAGFGLVALIGAGRLDLAWSPLFGLVALFGPSRLVSAWSPCLSLVALFRPGRLVSA